MSDSNLPARVLHASAVLKNAGITQMEIARRFGASQAQVSRVLSGHSVSRSKLAKEICIYAETLSAGVTRDAVVDNAELLDAICQVWDGSAAHARALATVIRSLAVLGQDLGRH
jgi:transcriptional regulator with XRE-family HTH domain